MDMEFISPPTTPKKIKLLPRTREVNQHSSEDKASTPVKASDSPVSRILSPDRYIPNRAQVDFDYCNSMLSPEPESENRPDDTTLPFDKYLSSSLLGPGTEVGSGNIRIGKRMIEVFGASTETETIPQCFKVPL